MPDRYVVYNAGCHSCRLLAGVITESCGGKLKSADIHGELARDLLDRATYPATWKFAPYLVYVRRDRVVAYTGWRGVLRLSWLLGLKGSFRVLQEMKRTRVRILPHQ